jgi:hypothetical protein
MNKKEKIAEQIKKTLGQFEQAEQLSPNPFFYTRVQARIQERRRKRSIFATILRPALLTALIVMNLSTAIWYLSGSDQDGQSGNRQELIEILVSDLNLENSQSNIFQIK